MDWKFWQKKDNQTLASSKAGKKLPRPKDLPYEVGRHLVVADGYSPDWVWQLQSTLKPRENSAQTVDFRVFDPESAVEMHVSVRDYSTLDHHPELILFEGWFDRKSGAVQIDKLLEDVG